MQQVVSAIMGTTPIGFPRSSGRSCCSTEAKYEFRSTNSQLTAGPSAPFPEQGVPGREVPAFAPWISGDPAATKLSAGPSTGSGNPLLCCTPIASIFALYLPIGNGIKMRGRVCFRGATLIAIRTEACHSSCEQHSSKYRHLTKRESPEARTNYAYIH